MRRRAFLAATALGSLSLSGCLRDSNPTPVIAPYHANSAVVKVDGYFNPLSKKSTEWFNTIFPKIVANHIADTGSGPFIELEYREYPETDAQRFVASAMNTVYTKTDSELTEIGDSTYFRAAKRLHNKLSSDMSLGTIKDTTLSILNEEYRLDEQNDELDQKEIREIATNEMKTATFPDKTHAQKLGVNGTPALTIDGEPLQEPLNYSAVKDVLNDY